MAISFILTLSVFLLISSVMQESCGEDQDCVSLFKQVLDKHNENETSLKREIESLNQVLALTQEVMDLKIRSVNEAKQVDKLTEENLDLRKQLDDIKRNETRQSAINRTLECQQKPHLEEVRKLVEVFNNNSDWNTLRIYLRATLDQDSVEFSQLESATSQGSIGLDNSIHLISLLLCAGLPVDSADNDGFTILHGAALGGHPQLVKLLLDHGASVNVRGRKGHTPLIYAAGCDNLELVKLLVQAGADTTAKDSYGKNALIEARRLNKKDVERYLLSLPH